MKLSVLALALVSIAALSTTPVRAEDREVEQITLSLKGTDMNDPASVAKLYKRLERSAKMVCGSEVYRERLDPVERAECERDALDTAIQEIGDQRLKTLHATKRASGTLASGRTDKSELDD